MSSLRVWHVDIDASATAMDGVAAYVWAVAREQALAGHAVTVFSREHVGLGRRLEAAETGIRIVVSPRTVVGMAPRAVLDELRHERPDVVQFHGAWMSQHAVLAPWLRRARIPYVYTAHGGLARIVRTSKRFRRGVYARALEVPLINGASGVAPVSEAELDEIRSVGGRFCGAVGVVHPPVSSDYVLAAAGQGADQPPPEGRPQLLFLGRFEIFQKGLDDLVEIARLAPDLDFNVVGQGVSEPGNDLDALRRGAPGNVYFRDPVHGEEKVTWFRRATLYVQPSRFEGFPVSIAEAMTLGVPCAVSARIAVARELEIQALAAVLPADHAGAARALTALAADRTRLVSLGRAGRSYASRHCRADSAADSLVDLYRASIRMLQGSMARAS